MKHTVIIKTKPEYSGKQSTPDGAVNGNGDLAVILGNSDSGLRIYISKIDLWYGIDSYKDGGIRPLGHIDIDVSVEMYDNYYVEQDMDKGEIRCDFSSGDKCCRIKLKVAKSQNIILIENYGNVEIKPRMNVFDGATDGKWGRISESDIQLIYRNFDDCDNKFKTYCYAAMKQFDNNYCVVVATNHDLETDEENIVKSTVIETISEISADILNDIENEHYKAWKEFYNKSRVELSDEFLELRWYASQYLLACTCGNLRFAPGLFGNFITVEKPSWHSDYHLNYNYQASFYAANSSNHPELTDTYHVPLEQFISNGKKDALKFGSKGIIFPVGIGPKGIYTEYNPKLKHWFERLFLGQKSNAIHSADIMIFRWNATRDKEYAEKHAYPFVKECISFFEDYATFENGRYSICDDSAHEVPMYREDYDPNKHEYRYVHDKNNTLTLSLIRMCIIAAIDMATELNIDNDKIGEWKDFLSKLSPMPTTITRFGRIFRYTEKGQRNHNDNDVGLQLIYPSGYVGLLSDNYDLKIARNSFNSRKKFCWHDGNAVSSYYPMAARLGVDPEVIIDNLKEDRRKREFPNLLYNCGAGGIEYCSVVANTINEMAMQSHQGTILLFPDWDKRIDCKFESLRADGAFLVSSSIEKGTIGKIILVSEVGSKLKIKNPFTKCKINSEDVTSENVIEMDTCPGQQIILEKA